MLTLAELGLWRIHWIEVGTVPGFSVIFWILGLRMLANPVIEFRRARRRLYAITKTHVIVFEGNTKGSLKRLSRAYLSYFTKTQYANGLGTIQFTSTEKGQRLGDRPELTTFAFFESPNDVEDLLIAGAKDSALAEVHQTNSMAGGAPELESNPAFTVVQRELRSGERLVWCGSSNEHTEFEPKSFLLIAAGMVFVLGPGWMLYETIIKHVGQPGFYWEAWLMVPFFLLPIGIGVVATVAGVACLVSPLLLKKRLSNTFYALTTWRAIIVNDSQSRKVRSFFTQHMGHIQRTEGPNGLGNVTFAEGEPDSDGHATPRIGFIGIHDAQIVEALLRSMLKPQDNPESP
jgi:hypothetical protein